VYQVVYKSIVELLDVRQKELLNGTIKLYDVLLTTVTVLRLCVLIRSYRVRDAHATPAFTPVNFSDFENFDALPNYIHECACN
jgi:hypothetical protein